jgi:hypothetical protein
VAEHLAALPAEARQAALDDFLSGREDATEIIEALVAVDPTGPPPPQEVDVADSSDLGDGEPEPPSAESAERWPALAVGQSVLATDRDNYGRVVADLGDRARVHFVSPDGYEATPILPKSILVNPDGSPLAVTGTSGDDWGPIRLGTLPPAESFPLEVLPGPARDLAEATAESIACPVDFPAVALLAAASGAIGRSASLLIKPGYFASASIYAALVGGPSSGKSPAIRAALAPVWFIAQMLYELWRAAMGAWESAKPDERGEEPILKRIASTDPTTEALGPLLANNPRGLVVAPDEMTKWVLSMDQYKGGKGGDRPFYLSAWCGEPVFIDRAKHTREPIAVPHPFLTVVGGMTPDMLSTLPEGRGRDDGFMARLLFAYPDRVPRRYSTQGIPDDVADEWRRLALTLWHREMRDVDGRPAPHLIRMTPEAAREWAAWCQAHYAEQEADDFPDSLEGPWGKLEAYAGRLALILHLMDLASDPTRTVAADLPELPRRIIADAARLVAYFKAHARRVHAAMGGKCTDGGEDVRALVRWILRNDLARFSERDIARNFDRFQDDPAALADALWWMAGNNLIRPSREPEEAPKPGRKRSPAYEVNPTLRTSPRFRHFRRNGRP